MKIHGVLWLTFLGAARGFQTSVTNALDAAGDAARGRSALTTMTMDRKYEAEHRAAIAKGFKPHADTKFHANEDPLVFSHRFQHFDPDEPGKLIYYQYEAKRHANVTVLSTEHVAKCKMATNATNNHTTIRLALPHNTASKLVIDKVLVLASGCEDADGTTKPFQGVVLAQSVTSSVKAMSIDGVETSVQERSLSAVQAAPTDIFEYSTLEFYKGKPGSLKASRQARFDSLSKAGKVAALNTDHFGGFASADEILEAATASVKAVEAAGDQREAARAERARAKRAKREAHVQARSNRTVSTTGYCYPDEYRIDIDHELNKLCPALSWADIQKGACCFGCYEGSGAQATGSVTSDDGYGNYNHRCEKYMLVGGCEYIFYLESPDDSPNCKGYSSSYSDYRLKVGIWEVDSGADDHCPHTDDYWSMNVAETHYARDGSHSYNRYKKKIPAKLPYDCSYDGSNYPEYQLQGYDPDGYMLASFPNPWSDEDPGSGYYFRIGTHSDIKASEEIDLSFEITNEDEPYEPADGVELTYSVKCKGCGVKLEVDLHMMVRSSQYNPYAEAYIVGDLSIQSNIDLTVKLSAKAEFEVPTPASLPLDCYVASGICLGAQLAGVGVKVGAQVGIDTTAKLAFEAELKLEYERKITTEGTFMVHWSGNDEKSFEVISKDFSDLKTTQEGPNGGYPKLEISAKAAAGIEIHPQVQIGLWWDLHVAAANAYAEADLVVTPTVTATFKWGSAGKEAGTDFIAALPKEESCSAMDIKYNSEEPAEPEANCCSRSSVPYCNEMCGKDHYLQLDVNVPASLHFKLQAKASADFGIWAAEFEWIRWIQKSGLKEDEVPFLTMVNHLASLCFFDV